MESLKCASLVLHIWIYRCQLRMKFEESYSINSVKRNYPSRLQKLFTNCKLIMFPKTSLNYGADTNLTLIITYEIPRLYFNELNRKFPGRLQKRTLKHGS